MDYKKANYYEGDSYNTGITKHIPISGTDTEILITIRYTRNSGLFNKKYRVDISLSNDNEYISKSLKEEICRHTEAIIKGNEKWENSEIPKPSEIFITLKSSFNKGNSVTLDAMKCDSVRRMLMGDEDEYGYK